MTMVFIPAGDFLMGSVNSDSSASDDEKPQRTVYLDAYWIDQTEVTNAQYALCVAAGVCQPPSETQSYTRSSYYGDAQYDNYPVIYVSWNEAAAYCAWVGGRLPTEAEWEKAARGTDGRIYPWGNQDPNCQLVNYSSCAGDTSAVGSYPAGASPYGLLDMAGNVWEWVQDRYSDSYYASSPASNPPGPSSGDYRVLRGGAWLNESRNARSADRGWLNPGNRYDSGGFRCSR
jgi:formylglycine-generating enzyme required for sulfatase activity